MEISSMITALVKYEVWQDSGHAHFDDFKVTKPEIVEVEKLTDINGLFSSITDVKILKQ